MSDYYDGERWQKYILQDSVMSPEGCFDGSNLVFNMSADGVSPFTHKSYSFWPIALSCLNLPPWLRMKLPAMWLCCIIPGPQTPDDFQPVLDIIADELNYLYHEGRLVRDAANSNHTFVSRVKLFGLICDFKALGPLLRGRKGLAHVDACYECHQRGKSVPGKSSIYPGEP